MARYALVIGISEYEEPFDMLNKANIDAHAVGKLLKEFGGYRVDVLNGTVTRTELIKRLKMFVTEQAVQSEALIYFTGHGFEVVDPDEADEPQGFLATSDCTVKVKDNNIISQEGGLALKFINTLIYQSKLSSLVVLLDACQSGHFLNNNLIEDSLKNMIYRDRFYLITGCRGFEKAITKKREQHSVFTGVLLDGLSRINTDEKGQITSDRLFDFISRELQGSKQEPIRMGKGRAIVLMEYQPIYPNTPLNSVSQAEIDKLIEILQIKNIDKNIQQAYNECLPKNWLGSRETEHKQILEALNNDVPRQEGKNPPIFEFVTRLINSDDSLNFERVRGRLKSWISETSKKHAINLVSTNSSSFSQGVPYLLIRLKPSKNKVGQFFVKAWFILDDKPEAGYGRFKALDSEEYDEGPYPIDRIPELLNYFLEQVMIKIEHLSVKPIIEFFLPQNCLNAEVDLWEVLDFMNSSFRVGTEYQVVVRSYERLLPRYRQQVMNSWRVKWSKVEELKPPLPQNVFELFNKVNGHNWDSLRASLVDKVGLKLTCPPISSRSLNPRLGSSKPDDVISALLSTGVPIAIWPRKTISDPNFADIINFLLDEGPLSNLPECVRKKRQEAVQKQIEDHLGQHLVLLWENPDRLPPDDSNFELETA